MFGLFLELIQVALGFREGLSRWPSDEEWAELLATSQRQAVAGLTFLAVEQLSKMGCKPPLPVLYEWIAISERIKEQNILFNQEAARLTKMFAEVGLHSMILKGQANARLYAAPWCRQPGDIDIYVEGGRELVIEKLRGLGLIDELGEYVCDAVAMASYHHVHLPPNEHGISVEVHYRPSSGLYHPWHNKRLQQYLTEEAQQGITLAEEGFYVPSIRFALIMQLAHILRHVVSEGVGMRQVIDYFHLLTACENNQVHGEGGMVHGYTENMEKTLKRLKLYRFAGALMWVLKNCLGLENEYLIAEPDERRGRILMKRVMEGGNFGHYHQKPHGLVRMNLYMMKYRMKDWALCPDEVLWCELRRIWFLLSSIPARIQRGRLSLG